MNLSKRAVDSCLWCIAGLVLGSSLTKIQLLSGLFTLPHFWEQAVTIVFFGSAVIGALGLLQSKLWGFVAVYVYILIATFLLSISVVPFLFGFVSLNVRTFTWLLLTTNLFVLAFTAFLHATKLKEKRKLKP